MFEREWTLFRFTRDYLVRSYESIDESEMLAADTPDGHTPLWWLGHLTFAADAGLRLLGVPGLAPPEWVKPFGPGSPPGGQGLEPRPSKSELLDLYARVADRLGEALPTADPARMAAEQPIGFLKPWVTTNAELIAHLLTTHQALHLGQLSEWRRRRGMSSIMTVAAPGA